MEALAVTLGSVGAVLLLAGLVGGGFEFSGWVMPKVGKFARLLSFGVGGTLVLAALGVAFASAGGERPAPAAEHTSQYAQVDAAPAGSGRVFVSPGYTANVFRMPTTDSTVVKVLPDGAGVTILCTTEGESVTSPVTGNTSSLWDGTTDGGFLPDVLVDTGTDQPTAPNCTG
jgi:hypothetical protein